MGGKASGVMLFSLLFECINFMILISCLLFSRFS